MTDQRPKNGSDIPSQARLQEALSQIAREIEVQLLRSSWLARIMRATFGGGDAGGAWSWRMAYDMMQAAAVMQVLQGTGHDTFSTARLLASRAERCIEEEQRSYLDAHPEMLARPGDVIDRLEPYRERITDEARAREITREVDRIMEGKGARTSVADAVTEDFRDRYPDMPSHLARGLGATYASVTELRDTEAIDQVRRENELREVALDLRDGRISGAREGEAVEGAPIADPDIRRVVDHERAGKFHSPFQDDGQRLSYRDAVERELDAAQIDRLLDGDVDVLKTQVEDRLDRLYAAKTWLQSDAATANSEATRAVVEEIADRELELHRADLVDGETERGETH